MDSQYQGECKRTNFASANSRLTQKLHESTSSFLPRPCISEFKVPRGRPKQSKIQVQNRNVLRDGQCINVPSDTRNLRSENAVRVRRSRRLHDQKMVEKRNNSSHCLSEKNHSDITNKDDPMEQLRNFVGFSMHGSFTSQSLFMHCLGLQRRTETATETTRISYENIYFSSAAVVSISPNTPQACGKCDKSEYSSNSNSNSLLRGQSSSNKKLDSAKEDCAAHGDDKLSLEKILEQMYLVYPHDLIDDPDALSKLNDEHDHLLSVIAHNAGCRC